MPIMPRGVNGLQACVNIHLSPTERIAGGEDVCALMAAVAAAMEATWETPNVAAWTNQQHTCVLLHVYEMHQYAPTILNLRYHVRGLVCAMCYVL